MHRPHHGHLEAERPRPVNGSQREGRKRLLAKVNGVAAQVQQEAPPRPCFSRIFSAAVPQAFSSHASLLFEADELLPFREGKAAVSVSIALTDEHGVEMLAARCCPLGGTSSPWHQRTRVLDSTRLEGVSSLRGALAPFFAVVVLLRFRFSTGWPFLLLVVFNYMLFNYMSV